MGKWCFHARSFIFDRIIIKVAGNQDRHNSSDEFDFRPLVSMAHLYVFWNEIWHWHIGLRWAIVALWDTCMNIWYSWQYHLGYGGSWGSPPPLPDKKLWLWMKAKTNGTHLTPPPPPHKKNLMKYMTPQPPCTSPKTNSDPPENNRSPPPPSSPGNKWLLPITTSFDFELK